jgi:hypothetical protein
MCYRYVDLRMKGDTGSGAEIVRVGIVVGQGLAALLCCAERSLFVL